MYGHRKRADSLGEESLAAPGNRTCLSGVPVRRSTNWATSPPQHLSKHQGSDRPCKTTLPRDIHEVRLPRSSRSKARLRTDSHGADYHISLHALGIFSSDGSAQIETVGFKRSCGVIDGDTVIVCEDRLRWTEWTGLTGPSCFCFFLCFFYSNGIQLQ